METFGERLKAARKKAGLNQKQLAKLAGMSQVTISDVETGRNKGSRDVVSLAKALNVSAEWLINGEQSGEADLVEAINKFVTVYRSITDEGRVFLLSAIKGIAMGFMREDRRSGSADVVPIKDRRKQ